MNGLRRAVRILVAAAAGAVMLSVFPAGVVHGGVVVQGVVVQSAPEPEPEPVAKDPIGMDEFGPFPRDRYEIACDEGGRFDTTRKFICLIQGGPFGFTKLSTGISGTVLGWSMGMTLMGPLTTAASSMADAYNTDIVGPLELKHLAWTVALTWCSILALRRQTSRAIGEFAVTVAAAFLGAWMIANPAGYMGGYISTIESFSDLIASASDGQTSASVSDSVRLQMHESFIAQPYDLLNWGSPLTGKCAETRNEILASGPHGNDDKPRNMMKDAGCDDAAKFNHDPSFTRLGSATVLGLGSELMTLLVLFLAVGAQVFQVLLLPLWAFMPVVLTLAMMPGGGRRLLGWWLGMNLGIGLMYAGTMLTLIFVTSAMDAFLSTGDDMGILQRMFVVDIVIVAGFWMRRALISAAKQIGRSFGDSVTRAMPARTSGGWTSLHASSNNPLRDMVRNMPGGREFHEVRHRSRQVRSAKRAGAGVAAKWVASRSGAKSAAKRAARR